MNRLRRLCTRYHRGLLVLSIITALPALLMLAGCNAPAWLTDAQKLLPVISSSITSVLSFLAALTGNPALSAALAGITTIITDVGNGVNDLIEAVEAYKSSPSDTLLQKIQGVADAIASNLKKVLSDTGVPAAIAEKIQAWAQLVVSQVDTWLAIVPEIHTAVQAHNLHLMAEPPKGVKIMTADEFKAAHNAIWEAPTGDAEIDKELSGALLTS